MNTTLREGNWPRMLALRFSLLVLNLDKQVLDFGRKIVKR